MGESTFASAMASLLDAGNDIRLRQFIRSLSRFAGPVGSVDDFTVGRGDT